MYLSIPPTLISSETVVPSMGGSETAPSTGTSEIVPLVGTSEAVAPSMEVFIPQSTLVEFIHLSHASQATDVTQLSTIIFESSSSATTHLTVPIARPPPEMVPLPIGPSSPSETYDATDTPSASSPPESFTLNLSLLPILRGPRRNTGTIADPRIPIHLCLHRSQ